MQEVNLKTKIENTVRNNLYLKAMQHFLQKNCHFIEWVIKQKKIYF